MAVSSTSETGPSLVAGKPSSPQYLCSKFYPNHSLKNKEAKKISIDEVIVLFTCVRILGTP